MEPYKIVSLTLLAQPLILLCGVPDAVHLPPADHPLTLQTAFLHDTPGPDIPRGRHADDSRQVEFREAMMDRGGTALSSQSPAPELWVELPSHFGLVFTRPILVDDETDLSDPSARLLVDGREGPVSVPQP